MAELLTKNISRAAIKRFTGGRDAERLYGFLVSLSSDIFEVKDEFTGPVIDSNKWTVNNGGGASAASPAIDVG